MSDTLLAASGADPRIGMLLQDKYKILKKLGEGGMGAVYEGEHTLIKRRVAIKCLHAHYASSPDIVARFHREALAATSIGHPNIIECTDMGRFPDGAFFMVLEFLDGRDWSHVLQASGPQPLGRVVHIMMQVCDALTAAHDKGVVHRDLKPENIFLIKRGADPDFVKVLDFGISKIKGSEGDGQGTSKNLTRTGMAMGTPYYMAPEQAQGKRDIDHRADIYALGVILFQALTGQYPFDDESYPMLVVKICTQDPPPIDQYRPDLPPGIVQLVRSMLAKRPEERPQTCEHVKAALVPFAGHAAAPVLASNAPPTAGLAVGTFDGQHGQSTGPFATAGRALTPATRAGSTATPFAAADDGPVPRASLSEVSGARPKLGLWIGLGGGAVGLVAIGIAAVVASGGGGATDGATTPPPTSATAPAVPPAVVATAQPAEVAPAPPAHVETPAAPVATVRVQITTTPADARLFLDDDPIPNPFDGDLPQTREPRALRVEREGYVTWVQDLALTVSQRVAVPPLRRGTGVRDTSTRGRAAAAGHDAPSIAAEAGRPATERPATERAATERPATEPASAEQADERPATIRVETPVATVGGGEREATPAATAEPTGAGTATKAGLLDPFGRRRSP